jgi:hypothetical protein
MMKYAPDQFDLKSDSVYEDPLLSSESHQLTQFSPSSSYHGSPVSKTSILKNGSPKQLLDSDEKRARRLIRNREAARR